MATRLLPLLLGRPRSDRSPKKGLDSLGLPACCRLGCRLGWGFCLLGWVPAWPIGLLPDRARRNTPLGSNGTKPAGQSAVVALQSSRNCSDWDWGLILARPMRLGGAPSRALQACCPVLLRPSALASVARSHDALLVCHEVGFLLHTRSLLLTCDIASCPFGAIDWPPSSLPRRGSQLSRPDPAPNGTGHRLAPEMDPRR